MTEELRHLAPFDPTAWLNERLVNCRRLAGINHRGDRDGWLEDAEHFERAIACIRDQQAALRAVLDTREAEAKATLTMYNAVENFSDPNPETLAQEKALLAASEAESTARAVLAKWSLP